MTWTSIRLELARTSEHPQGSLRHVYILHLPLTSEGLIDEPLLKSNAARATVHRYWGNEHTTNGYVIRTARGWALSYERGQSDDEIIFHLETHRLRVGDYVTITRPDGEQLPMRVVSALELVEPGDEAAGDTAPPPS